jgi:hypothetical protein
MAILRNFLCDTCFEKISEARGGNDYSNTCCSCQSDLADKKRRAHLASRKGLTVEERLELIEQWIYDYKPPRDINSILF